jgi:hypothetical protein
VQEKQISDEVSEEEDLEMEYGEGFLLEKNVEDAFFPDLTDDFGPLIEKVRAVVKFFREFLLNYMKSVLRHNILFPVIAIQIMFKCVFSYIGIGLNNQYTIHTLEPRKKSKSLMVALLIEIMLNG